MSTKPKRRRSASMKQLAEDMAQENAPTEQESSSKVPAENTLSVSTDSNDSSSQPQLSPVSTVSPVASKTSGTEKRKSTIKVKSSRRASFQLSNTVNNLAKESGVDHLIGLVNESSEKKVGMREQIEQLKAEIESRGEHIFFLDLVTPIVNPK